MLFNSLSFAIFLPLVFGIYWLIGEKRLHLQNLFVVVASYVFYGWWDWKFLLLITFTSLWAWASGLALGALHAPSAGGKVEELKSVKVDGFTPPREFYALFNFSTFPLLHLHEVSSRWHSSLTSASSASSSITTSSSTTPSRS